ncbi:stage V sporulation protein AD [Clostridia bacterium]|nr:stage V sporulation protein AD [Clostridia bacterium]
MINKGNGTIIFENPAEILSYASAVGPKENDGPLKGKFDFAAEDSTLGQDSWEKAESLLQKNALRIALQKGGVSESDIAVIFAGDLLNQCTGSSYSIRDTEIPFAGMYGACSTMAESLIMASIFSHSSHSPGNSHNTIAAALTSSHFCSAERQFRTPLDYGGQRTPTAQWTATAAGCVIVKNADSEYSKSSESSESNGNFRVKINSATIGRIIDKGIRDANNMGAAMAGAAYQTISSHLFATGTRAGDYDMIVTGDLGAVGSGILYDLFQKDGITLKSNHTDCGMILFDLEKQEVNAGASGCGCSASVMCAEILPRITSGELRNVLFTATGALMSPTMVQQGESIPGIAHALQLSAD